MQYILIFLFLEISLINLCKQLPYLQLSGLFLSKNSILIPYNGYKSGSNTFRIPQAYLFFLVYTLFRVGVVDEVKRFLIQNTQKMTADQQAIQESIFDVGFFYLLDQLHVIFCVDVVSLELCFGFQGRIRF
jgi:hypothetical protein